MNSRSAHTDFLPYRTFRRNAGLSKSQIPTWQGWYLKLLWSFWTIPQEQFCQRHRSCLKANNTFSPAKEEWFTARTKNLTNYTQIVFVLLAFISCLNSFQVSKNLQRQAQHSDWILEVFNLTLQEGFIDVGEMHDRSWRHAKEFRSSDFKKIVASLRKRTRSGCTAALTGRLRLRFGIELCNVFISAMLTFLLELTHAKNRYRNCWKCLEIYASARNFLHCSLISNCDIWFSVQSADSGTQVVAVA